MAKEDNIFYQLRMAYVPMLSGQVKLNGVDVPIKNGYASGNVYVVLNGVSDTGVSNKSMTRSSAAMQFRVFVKGDNLAGYEAEDIASQILALVLPKPNVTVVDNEYFEAIATLVGSNVPVYGTEGDTTTKILEQNIIIEHRVIHKKRGNNN